jgi:hypothetical protein
MLLTPKDNKHCMIRVYSKGPVSRKVPYYFFRVSGKINFNFGQSASIFSKSGVKTVLFLMKFLTFSGIDPPERVDGRLG